MLCHYCRHCYALFTRRFRCRHYVAIGFHYDTMPATILLPLSPRHYAAHAIIFAAIAITAAIIFAAIILRAFAFCHCSIFRHYFAVSAFAFSSR
jgi:hypothetical protein